MRSFRLATFAALSASLLFACSDDPTPAPATNDTGVDAPASETTPLPETGLSDATDDATDDAPADAPPTKSLVKLVTPISETLPEILLGVTFDKDGAIYATGWVGTGDASAIDQAVVVVKYTADGKLDEGFGTKGFAIKNVIAGKNGEVARSIVLQSDGKIVIAGEVEHAGATDARDRDIALVRFTAAGQVDESFGDKGVVLLDLSDGAVVGDGYVADLQSGLVVYPDDGLLVTAARKVDGRTDREFALVKLTKDGAKVDAYGDKGMLTVSFEDTNATAKVTRILPDGSTITSGYARGKETPTAIVRPILFKAKPNGTLDESFGGPEKKGLFAKALLPHTAEAYDVLPHGDGFVTSGYGKASGTERLDFLSLRLTASGALDTNYGTGGFTRVDVAGLDDRGRALVVLPGDRALLVGGGIPNDGITKGYLALLTKDGKADETFGPKGLQQIDFGGTADFLWAGALSPKKDVVVFVGLKGDSADAKKNDAAMALLPVP
jgi:uncharacterized delta-60 repeat protein